jgi:ribosomal protein S18 acetylase RimI-like enzyme
MNLVKLQTLPEDLDGLLAAWTFKPFRWWPGPSEAQLCALAAHRTTQLLQKPQNQSWAIRRGADLVALGILQPLDWDSRVLGMPAARIDLFAAGSYPERAAAVDAILDSALAQAVASGVRHVSVRVDAEDDAAIHRLEGRGFLTVDALMTFGAPLAALGSATDADAGVMTRPVDAADIQAVESIAAASFRDGRFHSDPSIAPEIATAVYRTWAAACCENRAADHTIVAVDDGRVAGFVACRIQADTSTFLDQPTGTIILIATASAARRRGVGAALVSAATRWFRSRGAIAAEVGTQLRNIAAGRLYERSGFRLVSGALSFRIIAS